MPVLFSLLVLLQTFSSCPIFDLLPVGCRCSNQPDDRLRSLLWTQLDLQAFLIDFTAFLLRFRCFGFPAPLRLRYMGAPCLVATPCFACPCDRSSRELHVHYCCSMLLPFLSLLPLVHQLRSYNVRFVGSQGPRYTLSALFYPILCCVSKRQNKRA